MVEIARFRRRIAQLREGALDAELVYGQGADAEEKPSPLRLAA